MQNLKPMDAVAALYSNDHHELSEAIVASLSRAIFNGIEIRPAGRVQRTLARVSYRILQRTTTSGKGKDARGSEVTVFSNRTLESVRTSLCQVAARIFQERNRVVGGGRGSNERQLHDDRSRDQNERWCCGTGCF